MDQEAMFNADILIVDDNEGNVLLLEDLLEDHSFNKLRSLTDPLKVLSEVKKTRPDLILLDIRMPGMSGFEVMEQLEGEFGNSRPPIMVLTAQTDLETRTKALALGAVEFLNKPFNHQIIIEKITNILAASRITTRHTNDTQALHHIVDAGDVSALTTLGYIDETTGLGNRRAVQKHILEELAQDKNVTAFFIEIDGAEALAKTYGYDIFDRAMQTLAEILLDSKISNLAMFGVWHPHQFVAIKETDVNVETEEHFANRIHNLLSGLHEIGSLYFQLSARVGYVGSEKLLKQPSELIRRAVLAVPSINSGTYSQAYSKKMDELNNHEAQIEAELRCAINNSEFYLKYQPKLSLESGELIGAEALIRWNSSRLGYIGPDQFIPIAESMGMINELGEWVFDESVKQLRDWNQEGRVGMDFKLAINASAIQLFNPNFLSFLKATLTQYKILPSQIQIEITESMFISNIDYAIKVLTDIRDLGISIAMDDFGTGFSSLSYMQSLPLDTLKIDRCFIDQMITNDKSKRLVKAVISLAHTFELEVVAEGIETKDQHDMILEMGCEYGQGYLFDAPLLPEEFPAQSSTK